MEEEQEMSQLDKLKYYTTLLLGTTACVSSFVFFFLIPWILDPYIATLLANFDPEPVICKTVQSDHLMGSKNCSWSSCKEGCTVDQYECDQIYVNYMHVTWEEYDDNNYEDDDDVWVGRGIPLFVNIKACGYPPHTNCSIFGDTHGIESAFFPCYYARANPNLVITNYSWAECVNAIIMALIVPNALCGISLGVVSYWWYPGCQERRCQYQLPPDQEDGEDKQDDDDSDNKDADEKEKCSSRDSAENLEGKSRNLDDEKDRDTTLTLSEEKV